MLASVFVIVLSIGIAWVNTDAAKYCWLLLAVAPRVADRWSGRRHRVRASPGADESSSAAGETGEDALTGRVTHILWRGRGWPSVRGCRADWRSALIPYRPWEAAVPLESFAASRAGDRRIGETGRTR